MNPFMKKVCAPMLALALGFTSGTGLASTGSGAPAANKVEIQTLKTAKNVKKAKKAPSWLFVLQAKKGTITKTDKKGVYMLTIKHSDMGPAIAFTDRPDRIVKKITPEQLKKLWKKGPNSFEKDPPNAVLSARGMNAEIIELTSLGVDGMYRIKFVPLSASNEWRNRQLVGLSVIVDGLERQQGGWDEDYGELQGGSVGEVVR